MTSTARFPDFFRRCALPFVTVLLAVSAAFLAGCGKEGRGIESELAVDGVAYDVTDYTSRNDTIRNTSGVPIDTITTVVMSMKLKLQTPYYNGCEARGGLELRLEGTDTARVYVVDPIARYESDESCNIGISGDTLQTLDIVNMTITRKLTAGFPGDVLFARMRVEQLGGPPIEFDVRHDLATPGADSTLYDITVEDAATGTPLDNALVEVTEAGTPNVLGSGVTANGGKFSFSVEYGLLPGLPGDPYLVKVTYDGRIKILRVVTDPSLSKRREAIIVRV